MPTKGHRNPAKSSPCYLTKTVLKARFDKVKSLMQEAIERRMPLTWTLDDLEKSAELFLAPDGYTNVMSDMVQPGRMVLHGRTWDPLADTWMEKLFAPANL